MSGAPVVLTVGTSQLEIDPAAGGRASSLVVAGLQLLARRSDADTAWGWYPMAPWAGRISNNTLNFAGKTYQMPPTLDGWAIHGTVYDAPWRVDSVVELATAAQAQLSIDLADPWPWPGTVRSTWRLTQEALSTVLEVSSESAEFPAMLGWHPWFRRQLDRGEPAVLDLPATEMFRRGADDLPTGAIVARPQGPYDDTFLLPGGHVGLHWPGALRLRCVTDCAYVVVYDEPLDALCVEPQTAPPDGINRWVQVVRPGAPLTASATWSWEVEPAPVG